MGSSVERPPNLAFGLVSLLSVETDESKRERGGGRGANLS